MYSAIRRVNGITHRSLCVPLTKFPSRRGAYSTDSLSPNGSVYVSKSTNPYFNLSLEDWLFRHKCHKEPLLLLYRDEPCVVIGRNQNPWKEVNLRALARAGIPFVRRRSGGGTVYHDLGNTNYSIHLPRSTFDRNSTAQVVVRAVRSLGIDAGVNERNDICVSNYKVSGSAYKIVNRRAYHHGTMLISTSLDTLGDLLRTTKESMITKGVASVRSPVRNLRDFNPGVDHESFVEATVRSFLDEYSIKEEVQYVEEDDMTTNISYIRQGMDELPRWDWAFGQTPEFTYTISHEFSWGAVRADIRSKHGIILSCDVTAGSGNDWLQEVGEKMEGARYGFVEDHGSDAESPQDLVQRRRREVWRWLCEEMAR